MRKLLSKEVAKRAKQFLACETIQDLGKLGFDTNRVLLTALNPKYYTFERPKKSGKMRTIEAPEYELKDLQRKFNFFLQCVYYTLQSPAAYGYIIRVKDKVYDKNILENAKKHLGAKYLLNADFEDFFHQISDKRIFQLLQNPPFKFKKKPAHLLSKIFTYKKRLPMGAPSSPVWSNIVTLPLDQQLLDWAKQQEINYTRFVDDLTFSSKNQAFSMEQVEAIQKICTNNQLKLNPTKTKFFNENDLKKVTGLVLRETVDIDPEFYKELERDIERVKRTAEVNVIMSKHNRNDLLREFKQEVDGMINFIGMIEGYDSQLFYDYRQKLKAALNPDDETLSARWTNFNYF